MEPQNTDPFAQFAQPSVAQAPAAPAPEPTPVAPEPAPTPNDPSAFVPYQGDPNPIEEPAPAAPTEQAPSGVDTATEVAAPAPSAPTEAYAPQATQAPAQEEPQYQSYEDYMNSIIGNVQEPAPTPKLEDVNQDDPVAIKQFFDDLVTTAVTQAEANVERKYAVKEAETRAWNETFEKYPSLRENGQMRETIHAVRMANFRKGIAMTPTQAAQVLLTGMNSEYQRGIADNQVHTTIENVQPVNGSSVEIPQANSHVDNLRAIQDGGESALAAILDAEVRAGRL